MSLEKVGPLGYGGERLNTRLPKILQELQGFTISGPLTGAAANTPIVVADGIDIQDTIVKALMFASGVPSDITSTVSIVDLRASGTLTLASVVAGATATINGKVYTCTNLVVNASNSSPGPYNFISGTYFLAQMASQNYSAAQQAGLLANAFAISTTAAAALITGGADYITAYSLFLSMSSADPTVVASVAAAVVTVKSVSEGTAGNSVGLVGCTGFGTITASASTLTGGGNGVQTGTVTCAAVAAADTVTIQGLTLTGVASTGLQGAVYELNQFVVSPSAFDLVGIGYSLGAATTLAASPNNATAAFIAQRVNANLFNRDEYSTYTGTEDYGVLASVNGAVVTFQATQDNSPSIVLTSSNNTRLAVTGSGTLTAGAREIKSTTNTSSNTVLLFWFRKERPELVGQVDIA